MDVFGSALATGSQLLRDAALDAAYELGVFDQLPCAPTSRRMRALFDVLVAHGVLVREGDVFARGVVPPRPVVLRAGWGLLAEVIRSDQPLPLERGDALLRYHAHLARVGVEAACELTTLIARLGGGPALLDVGAGTGTYASAWLDADAARRATVVDEAAVIALARAAMARFGDRVAYVEADARDARFEAHDVALLANVLHLHAPDGCAALVATAARAIRPGGRVVIKDLRVDDGRAAPYEGLAFALNMAIYTAGGDVYETSQLRGWLEGAGLVGIEEHRLPSQPDGIVLVGVRPRGAIATFAAITGHAAERADPVMPRAFRTMLAHATAELADDPAAAQIVAHYTEVMPAARAAQLASPLFQTPLDWARLPRLAHVLERFAAVTGVIVPRTATFGALYEATHYGGFMPMLYGMPADLAYFSSRGLDPLATIDRYLAAPMLHELTHFARERDALLPPHLDECVAGWLGRHIWRELAFPEPGDDTAIYAAPYLTQIGAAVARAFGADAVVHGQTGAAPWDAVLPARFLEAITRFGWDDWRARKTAHFLSDTLAPAPWVERILAAATRAPDPLLDREIVRDALHAGCLASEVLAGSSGTRVQAVFVAPRTLVIDEGWVVAGGRRVHWLPPGLRTPRSIEIDSRAEIDRWLDELTG